MSTEQESWTWVTLARAEDEHCLFTENRISSEMLAALAKNYKPTFRRAPVISGYQEGLPPLAGHEAESYPPVGSVEELEWDGLHLWGRLSDPGGKIAELVDAGVHQRSVQLNWEERSLELEGHQLYLRHVALLAGETPGIPGLLPLSEHFPYLHGDTPQKGSIWVPLKRAADNDCLGFTGGTLAALAKNYKSTFRRAPVISGYQEGLPPLSAREAERYPPVGSVEELVWDGIHLGGRLSDPSGKIAELIAAEVLQRSVELDVWDPLPELDGNEPYLRRVELVCRTDRSPSG